MSVWRKLAMVFAILTLSVGVWTFIYDLGFILHYGFDCNDVAAVVEDGPVDWPTGERPLWTIIPLYAFSFPFIFVGLLILIIRPKPHYHGRIRLGTE